MAALQERNGSYRLIFRYHGKQHTLALGKVEETEAHAIKGKAEYLLMRIGQHLIDVPAGMDIANFLACDGKPPDHYRKPVPKEATFAELRDSYLRTHENGTVEKNTLDTLKLHLSHFATTLGESFPANALQLSDLQRHVNRRTKEKNRSGGLISPTTVRKEVATLAGVWIWGNRMGMVEGDFPGKGLRYPKLDEPPPFKTWEEIERARGTNGDSDELWEYLYLEVSEITELLAYVREHAAHPFIYPMFCFAAHTGARRSEMMRAQVTDLDLAGQTVLIREKKRKRDKRSYRTVPLAPFLAGVLKEWLAVHPGGPHLFCLARVVGRSKKRSRTTGHQGQKSRPTGEKARRATVRVREEQAVAPLSRKEAYDHMKRTLAGSKWQVLKGWHVLRHSFISACAKKGTDQRLIDEWTGHSTEEQRKRYRHLSRTTQQQAMNLVFG